MAPLHPIDHFKVRCTKALTEQAQVSNWESKHVHWAQTQIEEFAKACHKLRRASAFGKHQDAIKLQARILAGFPARLCGKLYEAKFGKLAAKKITSVSWCEYERQINRIALKNGNADPCHVYAVAKGKGSIRWLNSPGSLTRQGQRALANVLSARLPSNDAEYNSEGKGREAAVSEIIRQIEKDKVTTFIVFDIANFFSSVKPNHLQWLALPKQVLEQIVFYNNTAVQYVQKGMSGKTRPARQGLPQGAIVSGKIASALLRRELCPLDGAMGKVTYCDDGVIGVSSPASAHNIVNALQKRFANLNGGPICFKKIEVRDISEGFEFLGYWIQKTGGTDDGTLAVIPSHPSKMKFKRKLYALFRKEGPTLDYGRAEVIFEQYFKRWRNSFSHWTPNAEQLEYTKYQLECWIGDFPMPTKPS